jgi:hypothetical protein
MGNSNGRTDTKRIGVAFADSLDGPWQRSDGPLLEPGSEGSWDDHCTTNPSLLHHPNGEFWLFYKSWNTADYETGKPPVRGNRKYGLATATKLEGPYRKHSRNPLVDFSGRGENRQCEDAFVWHEDGRFRMIVRDMGLFNHEVGLIMESRDGLSWSEPLIAYGPVRDYIEQPPAPKHLSKYGRFERPQLLLRNGLHNDPRRPLRDLDAVSVQDRVRLESSHWEGFLVGGVLHPDKQRAQSGVGCKTPPTQRRPRARARRHRRIPSMKRGARRAGCVAPAFTSPVAPTPQSRKRGI